MPESLRIDVYHHLAQDEGTAEVLRLLRRIEERIMALADDLKAGLKKLDDETTAIGALITTLSGKVKNSMTDAEVAEVTGQLDAISARLTSLAVDPLNPVPPPVPVPVPTP
ncbi:MAG: hypothetical protein V4597_11690 [Pseudomonadota bacterium]